MCELEQVSLNGLRDPAFLQCSDKHPQPLSDVLPLLCMSCALKATVEGLADLLQRLCRHRLMQGLRKTNLTSLAPRTRRRCLFRAIQTLPPPERTRHSPHTPG